MLNIQKSYLFIGSIISFALAIPAFATPNVQSFTQWCQAKNSVSAEAKRTIEVLLRIATTNNCQMADMKLKSIQELDIGAYWISPRTAAREFSFEETTAFYEDFYERKKITDLRPLGSFTNLIRLSIYNTEVSDLSPLAGLTNLVELDLKNNNISRLAPLNTLTKLTKLDLTDNPIYPKTCPVKPASVCKFSD
jgi:Leucine Rich repeats (2 copies)